MPSNEHPQLSQLNELLSRGPGPLHPTLRLQEHPRRWLRTALLRILKPYAQYQHEVDTVVAQHLAYQDRLGLRHSHQISRLENLVKELIATSESLRRSARDEEVT